MTAPAPTASRSGTRRASAGRQASASGVGHWSADLRDPAGLRVFVDLLPPRRLGRALDLGAGEGDLALALSARVDRLLALDPDPRALAVLRRRAAAVDPHLRRALQLPARIHNVDPVLAPAESLARWPSGSFELVACRNVLHLLRDAAAVLAEVRRLLRPGGLFLLSEPAVPAAVAAAWSELLSARDGLPQTYRSEAQHRELLVEAGFAARRAGAWSMRHHIPRAGHEELFRRARAVIGAWSDADRGALALRFRGERIEYGYRCPVWACRPVGGPGRAGHQEDER